MPNFMQRRKSILSLINNNQTQFENNNSVTNSATPQRVQNVNNTPQKPPVNTTPHYYHDDSAETSTGLFEVFSRLLHFRPEFAHRRFLDRAGDEKGATTIKVNATDDNNEPPQRDTEPSPPDSDNNNTYNSNQIYKSKPIFDYTTFAYGIIRSIRSGLAKCWKAIKRPWPNYKTPTIKELLDYHESTLPNYRITITNVPNFIPVMDAQLKSARAYNAHLLYKLYKDSFQDYRFPEEDHQHPNHTTHTALPTEDSLGNHSTVATRRLGSSNLGSGHPGSVYGLQGPPSDPIGGTSLIRSLIRCPLMPELVLRDPGTMFLSVVSCVTVLLMMVPGATHGGNPQGGGTGRRNVRDPPGWNPEREHSYSYRNWSQDILAWSLLCPDMDAPQQTAAVVLQLQGPARELARNLSWTNLTQGGQINGQQVDPLTFLMSHLATHFAPLGEESRLQALTELLNFNRHNHESIDGLLSRFMTLRHRAQTGGTGATMSYEGYSWLLLKACKVTQNQLLQILQPYQGRFPNTEAEFNALQLTLRRMGHILENSHGNVAHQLRTPQGHFFTNDQPTQNAPDPWAGGNDPWAQSAFPIQQAEPTPTQQNPWQSWTGTVNHDAPQASPTFYDNTQTHVDSGTDTETSSDDGDEPDYDDPALSGLTPAQIDEHFYWAYKTHRKTWRRHMKKPTRRVRRFVKRKGKGKGKGKSRFAFIADLSDEAYDQTFFGGKGKSKGKRRSSGKGKGRRTNPIGRDGQVMKCGICGSDTHFRAECPQRHGNSSAHVAHTHTAFTTYAGLGPLGDLLNEDPNTTHTFMTTDDNLPPNNENPFIPTQPRWNGVSIFNENNAATSSGNQLQQRLDGSWTFGDVNPANAVPIPGNESHGPMAPPYSPFEMAAPIRLSTITRYPQIWSNTNQTPEAIQRQPKGDLGAPTALRFQPCWRGSAQPG